MMNVIPLEHFLLMSAALFCIGLYAVLTRRNLVIMLIGIELMVNAGVINLAAFGAFEASHHEGQMMGIFAIVLSVASVAVALAIILKVYQQFNTIEPGKIDTLKN